MQSVLLKPLPFPGPAQLVTVWQTQPGNDVRRVAPANFLDWRAASSFANLAAYDSRRRTLPGDEPERDDVDALEILGALDRAVAGHEHLVPTLGEPLGPADEVDRAHVADAEDAKRSRGHVVQC